MALTDSYINATDLATYLGVNDTDDATLMTSACITASRFVTSYCGRDFNKTTTASARTYRADTGRSVDVDDFHTTTDLVVATDTGDSGSFTQTWSATDYSLEPINGIEAGIAGYPYRRISSAAALTFPCPGYHVNRVQVTAQWGWTAVPESIVLATKVMAAFQFNRKNAPLGVESFGEGGLIRINGVNVSDILNPYRRPDRTGLFIA